MYDSFRQCRSIQTDALAASDSRSDKQIHHTMEVKRQGREQSKEPRRLFLCQCVNGILVFLGGGDFLHRILDKHFLFRRVAENHIEGHILMTQGLGRKRLARARLVVCAEIGKVFLNLYWTDFLQDRAVEIVCDRLCHKLIESNG